MNYLLKGARVVDPSRELDSGPLDILVENGRIARLEEKISKTATAARRIKSADLKLLELKGMVVTPGLVDMHTHLREPGFEYKGLFAAAGRQPYETNSSGTQVLWAIHGNRMRQETSPFSSHLRLGWRKSRESYYKPIWIWFVSQTQE